MQNTPGKSVQTVRLLISLAVLLFSLTGNAYGSLKVVASLKPIHSLLAGVMQGVAEPQLLLGDAQSPHNMSLKPSQIGRLKEADLIVWVGAELEPALSHLLQPQSYRAEVVSLIAIPDLHLLPIRNRHEWHSHGHDHNHESDHQDRSPKAAIYDNHIWLSPENAAVIVRHLTGKLIELDSSNSTIYRNNSQILLNRLTTLDNQIRADLEKITNTPYIVFHDAYQYFEAHFDMHTVGTVSITPEQVSGARHIHRLRQTIKESGARCLFTEPQFEPKLVNTLAQGLEVKIGQLDPLGMQLPAGPDCYFSLIRGLADDLLYCLEEEQQK
jgi:zinc transport system substrate-binding protein